MQKHGEVSDASDEGCKGLLRCWVPLIRMELRYEEFKREYQVTVSSSLQDFQE